MTRLTWALLVLSVLAGCVENGTACQEISASHVVDAVQGSDILVDDRSVVLHASGSTVWERTPDGTCILVGVHDVRVGDRLGHDAIQLAESYPAQGSPHTIVVEHRV